MHIKDSKQPCSLSQGQAKRLRAGRGGVFSALMMVCAFSPSSSYCSKGKPFHPSEMHLQQQVVGGSFKCKLEQRGPLEYISLYWCLLTVHIIVFNPNPMNQNMLTDFGYPSSTRTHICCFTDVNNMLVRNRGTRGRFSPRLRDFKTKLPPQKVFGYTSCFISFLK
jgi:hypothetical protein